MAKRRFINRGIVIDAVNYQHLRGRLDSEAMLEQLGIDVAFRHRADQLMCHCPDLKGYHTNGDANPSFGFNEEKLAFNCFLCGGGNIIELVQMMLPEYAQRFKNDVQQDEAALGWIEQFADLNMQVDLQDRIQAILHPKIEEKPVMPEYPEDNLFQYRKIHSYLYERGLTKDVIVEMQVGFDDEHCGIVIPHFFQGKLRGWQVRHLVEDPRGTYHCEVHSCNFKNDKPTKVSKYKNTKGFPKVNTLYGYDRMKKYLREEDGESIIMVESPMTALKLMSLGFNRVVATFGQFSIEQGSLVMAVPTVYFWPDNDKAGWENAQRCIESLGRYAKVKIVPVVPNLKGDAADLDTVAEVSEYLQNAYPAGLFKAYTEGKILPKLDEVLAPSAH